MQPFRDILVAVVGLTPQVITETLYFLTQVLTPPVSLVEIHVLTTQPGKERVVTQLLDRSRGQFHAFCEEYGLNPNAIGFEVHVFRDAAHVPLEDIRTAADSAAVADQLATFVRQLTSDPTTRLYCSLAGGRKTQSVLLGFALQLYGRPQDTLLHVLVDDKFQNNPEFFYPARVSRPLCAPDSRLLDAHAARIDVAEIPFLRLRDTLFKHFPRPTQGFAPTVAQGQRTLDALPSPRPLIIIWSNRCIRIGRTEIALPPLEFVLYAILAQRCISKQGDGFVTLNELDAMRGEILQRYASLYHPQAGRVARLRDTWARGLPSDSVRSHFANINRKLRQALQDATLTAFYQVTGKGSYGNTRYGLLLGPGNIELRED